MEKPVTITTVEGLKLNGQVFLPDDSGKANPAVILCHGIPSGIVDPNDGGYAELARTICSEGFAVLSFNFRGCRGSEGNFDILGWVNDLKAATDYMLDLPAVNGKLVYVGFSAGAAVSIYNGAKDPRATGICACACPADFSSIYAADQTQFTIDYFRKAGIISDHNFPPSFEEWINHFRIVEPVDVVGEISPRPLMLIHSADDPVVPLNDSHRLLRQAGEPKQLVILEGGEHRLRRHETAVNTIIKWLQTNFTNSK